jgi:G:T-mismatch repair DNA endonuclease (very short patch repair protein)
MVKMELIRDKKGKFLKGHKPLGGFNSRFKKGRKSIFTEETKRKISQSHKLRFRLHPELNKIRSIQIKKLMSEGKIEGFQKGELNPMRNEKTKEKIRKAVRIQMQTRVLPMKDSTIEIKIQKYLSKLHIEYIAHKYISEITHAYQCDIFIPTQEGINQKTVIECDGCFFHCCPICNKKEYPWTLKRKEMDNIRTKELQEQGFRVIRLWEHEIKNIKLKDIAIKVGWLK